MGKDKKIAYSSKSKSVKELKSKTKIGKLNEPMVQEKLENSQSKADKPDKPIKKEKKFKASIPIVTAISGKRQVFID